MEKEKRKAWLIVGGILLILLIIVIFILTNGRETYTSEDGERQSISALVCTTGNQENAFFYSTIANTVTNQIKVTFRGEQFDKLFYEYMGVYRSDEVAHEDEVRFHANYDIYMGGNDIRLNSLNPSYSAANSKFILTLYVDDYARINRVTSGFFFIDEDLIEDFENYSIDKMKNYYESKEFNENVKK